MVRRIVLFVLAFLCIGKAFAFDETVDRSDPNFIRLSLLFCGPTDTLYGCVGHVALRLQCPHFKLDEVFSYEGEPVEHQVGRFLAGHLKMGMFASPTEEFLKEYAAEGRGAWEYPLELSPAAKIRLWKLLDERVAQGADLPYDYIRRGCAQSALKNLSAAIAPEPIAAEKSAQFGKTRREIMHETLSGFPWTRLFIHLTSGPEADQMQSSTDCVIMPHDLLVYLSGLRVSGRPILAGEPIELQPQTREVKRGAAPTPLVCAALLLGLAILGCFWAKRTIFFALAVLYVALAVFETYVGVFSSLPAARWNVLLLPFNPLPILFWRWRKYWAKPFAALLVSWAIWVFVAPHLPTDPALAVLALAYAVGLPYGVSFLQGEG